jgi:regulator of sigma E protease
MTNVLLGIVFLGVLILVHETGHFLAARAMGVAVEAFSIGMGPVLLHKTLGGTDYRLSLVPLGGYCAMKGEKNGERSFDRDSFTGVHPLRRIFIAVAGPCSNVAFAFAAFTVIALVGYTYYSADNTIILADEVYPEIYSEARAAGLKTGDRILAIDGVPTPTFFDLSRAISTHPEQRLRFDVDRAGTRLRLDVTPLLDTQTVSGKIGVTNDVTTIAPREATRYGILAALGQGAAETARLVGISVKSLSLVFRADDIAASVSGPVRLTVMLGDTAQTGFKVGFRAGLVSLLNFMSLISVSLFLMNLLPIPILDGGLVLFALAEWFTRKPVQPKVQQYIQYAGIGVIALLFGVAMWSDIGYLKG